MKVLANAYGQRLWGDGYDFKKFIAYYYMFIALLALLYSMNILLGKYLLLPDSYKEIAPVIFILFYPLTFLHGGFVYDFPEFLFIVIYLILLRSEFKILPTLVYGLAILNKESNVLLIIYDFTINYKNYDKKNIFPVAIKMIFGLSIFIFTRVLFLNNPGAGMDYRPMFNLQFYTTLKTYLSFNFVYGGGILFPKSFNIINLAIIFYLIGHKWPVAPKNLRMSLMIMTSILIPLTILFGYIDEIRNYSLIFPIVFLLTSNTIYTIYNEKQS
jgi:hypothetical protein